MGLALLIVGILALFVVLFRYLRRPLGEPRFYDAVEAEEPEPLPEELGEGEIDLETYKAHQESKTPIRNF